MPEETLQAMSQGPAVAVLRGGDLLGNDGVTRDEDGVPTRFRILEYGEGSYTRDGETTPFTFAPHHAAAMVAYQNQKGESIPVDCEHMSYVLGRALQEEGEDVTGAEAKAFSLLGARLAAGYVTLTAAEDGLYADVERWTPAARTMLREGAVRQFSPVIHGMDTASPFLTSLALTNRPALDNQGTLVAAATAVLSEMRDGAAEGLAARLAKLLELDAGAGVETIEGAISALQERARIGDEALAKLEEVQAGQANDAEAAKAEAMTALIQEGLRDGKLTKHQAENWAPKQSPEALRSYLKTTRANSVVVLSAAFGSGDDGRPELPAVPEVTGGGRGEGPNAGEIARRCGMSLEAVRAARQK